jgi:predicted PurR-regulated permease PerM
MLRENQADWLAREQAPALVFGALAAVVAYFCWLVVEPLLAPIACALALAVVAQPAHAWLVRRIKYPSLAAALAMLLVAAVLLVPATYAVRQVSQEAVAAATLVQTAVKDGRWRAFVDRNPNLSTAINWLDARLDLQEQLGKLSEHVPLAVQKIMSGSLQFAVGAGVALFLLFFFLRDRAQILRAIGGLLPLSAGESARVFARVNDTVYAIIYGTVAVALVQGSLGGLMFWWLDLHAPLLWGCAMAVLSIVPMVGTAIIWLPAAIYLLLQGDPHKALILAAWGFFVIGLIDNVLKPAIVKGRLRAHIVPVFVSILGGLAAFGAAGVIIGPVILSLALALIDIWRRRARAEPP